MLKLSKIFQPPSLRFLVVFGFGLVILPMLIALVSAIYSIDRLTTVSRMTVYRAVRVTRESQILLEKLNVMERSARQYFVLSDPVFFDAYEVAHDEFVAMIHDLMSLVGQDDLWHSMKELTADEFELYRSMSGLDSGRMDMESISERFKVLNQLVHDLGEQSAELVNEEVRQINESYEDLKKRIFTQSSFLLPSSFILIFFFVHLIIKPIHQLDSAIRILESGDFETPIQVRGTLDLEYLGRQLNYLRVRLKQLEEEKQRFLRNVSHELKTPLATINEGVGLLADQVVGELNAEQADITGILQESSTKLDNLIGDLLSFSQLQSQMGESTREHLDLSRLVESVLNGYRINLKAKGITLISDLPPLKIFGVPNEFRIIVDNLLSNAVKYSPKRGEIRISLSQDDEHVQLDIEDNGPGIAPEEREKIFDLFYQGRATREAGIDGSGLGLAIINECVLAHHGSIEVVDPEYGRTGAHFRVRIPQDLRKISR